MSRVITLTSPSGATLKTKEKYVDDDIAIQVDGAENVVAGNIKSGVTILGVAGTLPAAPSGTLSISENGTYDVSSYASASVNVSGGIEIEETTALYTSIPTRATSTYNSTKYTCVNPTPLKIKKLYLINKDTGDKTEVLDGTYQVYRVPNDNFSYDIKLETINGELYLTILSFINGINFSYNQNGTAFYLIEWFPEDFKYNPIALSQTKVFCRDWVTTTISCYRNAGYQKTSISKQFKGVYSDFYTAQLGNSTIGFYFALVLGTTNLTKE